MINILEYLENTVKTYSNKTAFANETDEITFGRIYENARKIGSYLYRNGHYKEPVVVFMKKHPDTITAFQGVIYAGCTYVPLDEEMPKHRIRLIFESLKPKAVICDDSTFDIVSSMTECRLYRYNDMTAQNEDTEALLYIRSRAIDIDPIYIVFTSGSTGVPKGVAACHRCVIDYIEALSGVLQVSDSTIFANQTPLYVDACLKEIYTVLKYGASAYLVPKEYFMFPLKLVDFLNKYRINTICWVVPALTIISSLGAFETEVPKYLKTIAFGSEVFPISQFNLWRKYVPDARYINLYGPTEATGMSCYYEVNREFSADEAIPIGKPFINKEILLLKDDNTLSGTGEEGEICIRGTSLTLGYYGDFQKTNEAFVQNPLNPYYPELIYRTGDIGRYNKDGDLMFISRKDHQIKHMGHRIELGEIDMVCSQLEGINSSCTIFEEKKKKLILYYSGKAEVITIIAYLKEKLPRYMVPSEVIPIKSLPLTLNGKINRLELKEMYAAKFNKISK